LDHSIEHRPGPPGPQRTLAWGLGLLLLGVLPTGYPADGIWDRVEEGAARTYDRSGALVREGVDLGAAAGEAVVGKGVEQGKSFAEDTASHFSRDGSPEEIQARVDAMAAKALEGYSNRTPRPLSCSSGPISMRCSTCASYPSP